MRRIIGGPFVRGGIYPSTVEHGGMKAVDEC